MLLRTIAILGALVTAPAFAHEAEIASTNDIHATQARLEASSTAEFATVDDSNGGTPKTSYGLAIATLALVGFMSRR